MNKIIQGDCLESLKTIESESVNCCVTSPPYYGLRSYFPDVVVLKSDAPEWVNLKLMEIGVLPIHKK